MIEKATGTTDIAQAPTPGTTIPQRSTGDVTATDEAVSIALPGIKDVTGAKAGKNTTVYPGAAKATDLAVQPTTDGGIRALAVLKDATAPREQRYDIGLPAGARLVKLDNGAVRPREPPPVWSADVRLGPSPGKPGASPELSHQVWPGASPGRSAAFSGDSRRRLPSIPQGEMPGGHAK
ncbi:hypothetical protein ACFWAT_06445 [Streptomyces syringium]|uniref:hypothetical protein n=1 Tax=Streptomyces syringium TaxID=76729 RepID=UPI0036589AF5